MKRSTFNDGVCALAGYTREEYEANPIPLVDLVFEEDRPVIRKQLERVQNGEKNFNYTVRIHTKDGGYKWINGVTTVTDNVGDLYSVSAVLTDVTEQQEKEAVYKKWQQNLIQKGPKSYTLYALLLLDVDGFKLINDSFGHGVGDQVLIDISRALQSVLRDGDLVCRLGGDEFLICLSAVPSKSVILRKTKQILQLVHSVAKLEVKLSVSAGIAVCPEDGNSFEALYPKVDKALYHIKEHGKDNCAFYDVNMKTPLISTEELFFTPIDLPNKPTMLLVDNHQANRKLMSGEFSADFKVETAEDGASALDYLHSNAKNVSVVLMELSLPDMDGLAMLEHMQKQESTAAIPVVVVSAMDERAAALGAIKAGASDFVTKPVDPTLLRIRVESAISKAENERLRAQNRFLALLKSQEKQ